MAGEMKVRFGWLKFMYIYTIIGVGGLGLGILFLPGAIRDLFGWPEQDPVFFGISGGVYLAFALLSILALKSPVKFSPLLLMQLTYKVIWIIGVAIPLLVSGNFPSHGLLAIVIFATYIIGDLIAIPFPYLFRKVKE